MLARAPPRLRLANEELERCEALIRIPVDAAYGSLNLAQAVQIVCYEVRMALAAGGPIAGDTPMPATADERQALDAHLERVMRASGFMHDGNAGQLGTRVRRLVARARPDDGEVRILRGWLAALERRLRPEE
jgi:tRNA C32,U32 (ribose-2'-O)-methylase TrmJ